MPPPPSATNERVKRMVGRVLTSNGITRCEKGTVGLVGGEQLSAAEGGICWH